MQVTWSKDQTLKLWNIDHNVRRRCNQVHMEDTFSSRSADYPINLALNQDQNAIVNGSSIENGNGY